MIHEFISEHPPHCPAGDSFALNSGKTLRSSSLFAHLSSGKFQSYCGNRLWSPAASCDYPTFFREFRSNITWNRAVQPWEHALLLVVGPQLCCGYYGDTPEGPPDTLRDVAGMPGKPSYPPLLPTGCHNGIKGKLGKFSRRGRKFTFSEPSWKAPRDLFKLLPDQTGWAYVWFAFRRRRLQCALGGTKPESLCLLCLECSEAAVIPSPCLCTGFQNVRFF